jgi:hypothetical protein
MVESCQTHASISDAIKVDNQELFSEVSKDFPETPYKFENHLRGLLFRARLYAWKHTFESILGNTKII